MNEKVLRHKEICDGLNELYARKNHDYGDSFHTTFVEEGLAMARIRLGDKFSRFKTLSRLSCNDSDQQQVTDESIRDTLLDLANYAIMTVLEMDTPDESHATLYAYDKPTGTQESRHAGACRLTACDKGLPPQAWPTGLDFGSGFVRFRLFLQLVLGRCFCNRFGGFGFFQRAGDDVN